MPHSDVSFGSLSLRPRRNRRGGQGRRRPRNDSHQPNPNLEPIANLRFPNNLTTHSPSHHSSSEQTARSRAIVEPGETSSVADHPVNRYEDGEVRRFGAGESYRPFNRGDRERSPHPRSPAPRARSPLPRARSPLPRARSPAARARSPLPRRERGRTPPAGSDSYVPGRASPRRRSRSIDRYRRVSPVRADTWRRQDRSRSRARSPPRPRSPRRPSPPPRRGSPGRFSPRRDDRIDRTRSPRRDYDARQNK